MRKMCPMSYANNKGADQTAHPRSLISAFIVRCLDSIISLNSIAEISRLQLASVAAQAGLCLAWSETPEDTFCRVVAPILILSHCSDPSLILSSSLQNVLFRMHLTKRHDVGSYILLYPRYALCPWEMTNQDAFLICKF